MPFLVFEPFLAPCPFSESLAFPLFLRHLKQTKVADNPHQEPSQLPFRFHFHFLKPFHRNLQQHLLWLDLFLVAVVCMTSVYCCYIEGCKKAVDMAIPYSIVDRTKCSSWAHIVWLRSSLAKLVLPWSFNFVAFVIYLASYWKSTCTALLFLLYCIWNAKRSWKEMVGIISISCILNFYQSYMYVLSGLLVLSNKIDIIF